MNISPQDVIVFGQRREAIKDDFPHRYPTVRVCRPTPAVISPIILCPNKFLQIAAIAQSSRVRRRPRPVKFIANIAAKRPRGMDLWVSGDWGRVGSSRSPIGGIGVLVKDWKRIGSALYRVLQFFAVQGIVVLCSR